MLVLTLLTILLPATLATLPFALTKTIPEQLWDVPADMAEKTMQQHVDKTLWVQDRTEHCDEHMSVKIGSGLYNAMTILNTVLVARGNLADAVPGGLSGISRANWESHGGAGFLTPDDLVELEERYFGTLNQEERDHVTNILFNSVQLLPSVLWQCDFSDPHCDDTTWAFVNGEDLHYPRIYICPLFKQSAASWWNVLEQSGQALDRDSRDSQPRVLLHESFHLASKWDESNGIRHPEHFIDDHELDCADIGHSVGRSDMCYPCTAYGRYAAQVLTFKRPDKTLANAENFVFYVIDTYLGILRGMPPASTTETASLGGQLLDNELHSMNETLLEQEVLRRTKAYRLNVHDKARSEL
ncbi:hypothetical protein HII31_01100 [Pseudocercospora fuligena]|uniref:Lysine-specific metallo-endopeptidase domain-containing protein n=1 Tax=Pseudocercospora fuligena TaxID=685502 RepID=A0A8H6RUG6_9PEZI|nr:hypothetical protein HII31_01100 [Pseudocercospora fuligena]